MANRILKLFISILYITSYKGYCVLCRVIGKKTPSTFVILTYHSIPPDRKERFIRHMDMLKRYHLVFPDTNIDLNAGRHYVAVTFDDGYECIVQNALPELVKRNIPATLFIPTGYLGQRPGWIADKNNNNFNEPVMSADRVQSLKNSSIKIGSHSVHHRSLPQLHEKEALKELVDSKTYLESLLTVKITGFSFPYGAYNNTVLDLAKQAGYTRVFCSWPLFPPSRMNGFLIGRTPVSLDQTALEFRLKLMGAYQWLTIGITVKRHLFDVLKKNAHDTAPSTDKAWD